MSWAQADRYVSRTGTRWSAGLGGRMGPGEGTARLGCVRGLRPGWREGLTVLLVLNVSCSSSPLPVLSNRLIHSGLSSV